MINHDVTDGAYSLLRFYLEAYESLKSEKRTQEKKNPKTVPQLFVPPVAPSRSHRDLRGYRLCFNVGAVEFYRSTGSHEKVASSGYLRALPSQSALSMGWTSSFAAIERFQNQRIAPGPNTKFRVTVLGVRGSNLPTSFTSKFVATWIGQGIRDLFGWTVDLENHDVEVVATVLMSATGCRTVGVLSLGLTLCRASYTETIAGLLANQPNKLEDKQEYLNNPHSFTVARGTYLIRQMLDIAEKLQEPRASWCLVRRAVKSDQFRRKFLNATNTRGETPLILAAKACDPRLVSLILQLGKQKIKEIKLPQNNNPNIQNRLRLRTDMLRCDNRKYDALMYSCEKGDNSTLSVLLSHKTGTFNWGFNKLCERSLTVAATACQPHSLNLLLHHLAATKEQIPPPSLCWPALQAAILIGHSLTIALILDYMRIFTDKHTHNKTKMKEKESNGNIVRSTPISQDIITALFSKASKSRSSLPLPTSSSYRSLSSVHLLLRANACLSGGDKEAIPLLNFLPDDMKSEVKIGKDLPSDGIFSQPLSDLKDDDYDTNEMETKIEIKINNIQDNLQNNNKIQNNLQYDNFQEIEIENVDLEKGKEKEKEKIIKIGSSQLPSKQKKVRLLGKNLVKFQYYEQEKQIWLNLLLSIFQQTSSSFFLCSSSTQLILNYLVV